MRVDLRSDLDNVVAKMVVGRVNDLAEQVARQARQRDPGVNIWITAEDERVRPAHAKADGQRVPGNLRFQLRKQVYTRGGGRGSRVSGFTKLGPPGEYDLAREPRDEDLPDDQKKRCRCEMETAHGLIAERVRASRAVAQGSRASARVSVSFNRIVESEHGTSQDRPSRMMGGALDAVAARLR